MLVVNGNFGCGSSASTLHRRSPSGGGAIVVSFAEIFRNGNIAMGVPA